MDDRGKPLQPGKPLTKLHLLKGLSISKGGLILKDGNWIPVDKRLINLLPRDREYTFLEAYISLRVDLDNEAEISINGYARLWSWSRNKVRHFVEGLRTGKGHSVDTQRTGKGQELRLIFNSLKECKDRRGTGEGHPKDRRGTTTTNPNTNPENINTLSDEKILKVFEWCWKKYPTSGGDKKKSFAKFQKTVKTTDDVHRWRAALDTYIEEVETDRENGFKDRRFKSPETFFNNWEGYVPDNWQEWIPEKTNAATE